MYKFIVLCAIFAAATAEPSVALYSLPSTQYSIVGPATTTIAKQESSVIHPSPVSYYSTGPLVYTHFIKKRSAPWSLSYIAPSSYVAPTPYIAPTYVSGTPLINTNILPTFTHISPAVAPISSAVHLIKKRSAPLLPTSYIAPQPYASVSSPFITTYASALGYPSTHLVSQPIVYSNFIKK